MAEENRLLETHRSSERPPEPRALFYILSFFLPPGGLVLAALFMSKAEEDNKRFGRRCLTAVLIFIGLAVLFWACYIVFIAAWVFKALPSLYS
jgi:CHASE2 domain-containing sensor protein